MRNDEVAEWGMRRARGWLEGAVSALRAGDLPRAAYESQMAVELAAKSVFFALGIEFPKEHDVSKVFQKLAGRKDLPQKFRSQVPFIAETLALLAKERGRAGYGWMEGITDDYFKDRAPEAVDRAKRVCEACESLLKHLFQTKK